MTNKEFIKQVFIKANEIEDKLDKLYEQYLETNSRAKASEMLTEIRRLRRDHRLTMQLTDGY